MFKVGLTGGIGSGKSLVCQIFRKLGIPVFEADTEARRIMAEDSGIRDELIKEFGKNTFRGEGLNREYLAGKIFGDPEARKRVNSIVHPSIRNYFLAWATRQDAPYVIEEAAILFESGAWKDMDFSIVVTAPEDVRIKRIMERDGLTREQVLERLDAQSDPEDTAKLADFSILNDGKEMILSRIIEAHEMILERLS